MCGEQLLRYLPLAALLLFLQTCFITEAFQQLVPNSRHVIVKRQTFVPQNVSLGLQRASSRNTDYGPWGPWTESSDCSRTCGGGISYQDRICMDTRADGRHSCVGASRRYFSCNIEDCPDYSKDYRSVQCARFNTLPYEGKFYSWEPFYKAQNPCELNCMPKGQRFYTRMARKVFDGTKCRDDGSFDVCVDGICMPVGCDKQLGSALQEDVCRVCGGDGNSCTVVHGIFDKDDFQVGYNDILLIPVGATSIFIQEVQPTNNYLAVRNAAGEFYLNGNWRIQLPREMRFAGTLFQYERKHQGALAPEALRAAGPTTEPIFIVLLYQERNLGIKYEYSIPAGSSVDGPDSYSWTFGDFEECSLPCGGGVQHRPVRCIRDSNRDVVDDSLCDPVQKPAANASCNTQPCAADWQIGEWSDCSAPCGGGAQFRLVYCQQKKEGNTSALVPDELCTGPKPLFMRTCNVDSECPAWVTKEWSECDVACGSGKRQRSVECWLPGAEEPTDESACSGADRPAVEEGCSRGPCEGVEWIVSEWSGCGEGPCSPRVESRGAHCANEQGAIFPDSACEASRRPDLTRDCDSTSMCEPMWHASQWSECSATCGPGVQSRVVFCGVWENESVIKIDAEKCEPDKKFEQMQNCTADACQGVWFTGPWTKCSAPCSGGTRQRKILCFHEETVVDSSQCDTNEQPFDSEACNEAPCDDDEMMLLPHGCKDSKHGCCPDGVTASGQELDGCPTANLTSANTTCEEADYGCCADNFTLALGPFRKGCPGVTTSCNSTKHGCCPDDVTAAAGPGHEGCAVMSNCTDSEHGCCPDGLTSAEGSDFEGCPLDNCTNSTYGCCPGGLTLAEGPDLEGCPTDNCTNSTHGCCPDGQTPAEGPDSEGCAEEVANCASSPLGCCPDGVTPIGGTDLESCPENNCTNSTNGCCPDGKTPAEGPNLEGCPDLESSGEDCYTTKHGCCPDKMTQATGPGQEGCEGVGNDTDCSVSAFGCCDDNMVAASGPFKLGCLEDEGSGEEDPSLPCHETTFGCCPDNVTKAKDFELSNCPIDCNNTSFGCCPDNTTVATGPDGAGCYPEDCSDSTYGCCPDNITSATGVDGEGCYPDDCANSTYGCCDDNVTISTGPDGKGCYPEDCTNSTYGCCDDNVTIAAGPEGKGCYPEDCANSTYGCCDDNVTIAAGPDGKGCYQEDCSNSTYGCCDDNVTIAAGPDGKGCYPEDCSNSTYGCCDDNVTMASGPDGKGCYPEDCANSTYGCCDDNVTAALGVDNEGCGNVTNCTSSEFGCCPDGMTSASGSEFEGCDETVLTTPMMTTTTRKVAECDNTMFGCCPDEETTALGPNLQGCCFGMRFGCCPDNLTAALGPTFMGCGCQTYPYGCCPDNITPAQGFNFLGCRCEHFRYGCCQDKATPATGPHFEGCRCELMQYGCCPDGRTPVAGPGGQGCGCDSSRYGCCPNGKTAASSADLAGCPCDTLPYGCCPDGRTPARSADVGGCPCDTYRFGCCLDGRTVARGPNLEGCPCATTRFGCCPDGRTAAPGPDGQGCSCETTPYGCCADGFTPARGRDLEGCPRAQPPTPRLRTEVCSLAKEVGPCRNYTVKWFFDVAYGTCTRFWYGGCDGNGNAFATQEECEEHCVNPQGTEACRLPKVSGPCDGKYNVFYYDIGTRACEEFSYGGCLGNSNRFSTRERCEQQCSGLQQPDISVDKCSLPKDEGPCDKSVIRWYYNAQNRRCEQFYYGGCQGNANRYESRGACEHACLAATEPPAEADVCTLPQEPGSCSEYTERWYHDSGSGQCRRFHYGGCQGNGNNFASRRDCERRCSAQAATEATPDEEFRTEFCLLTQDPGPCNSASLHWSYDSSDGVCKEFYYGGCQGNRNRFKTRAECEARCVQSQDVCGLSAVKGPCSGSFNQWYYSREKDDCFEFLFSGCQGNANRFDDRESCYRKCKRVMPTAEPSPTPDDVCSLPQEPGPCNAYYPLWYYDSADTICKSFVYGGCDGNDNRFDNRADCELRCARKTTARETSVTYPDHSKSSNEDVCRLAVETGPCAETHQRWFYDSQSQACLPFVYSGCGGNKNRFKTPEICLRFCTGIKAVALDKKSVYYAVETSTSRIDGTSTSAGGAVCPPSKCGEIQCPYGIEESFGPDGCSSCRCSNPCEVHVCPEGSRCAIDVTRTSQEGTRTEPVCRRVDKPGQCSPPEVLSLTYKECDRRCRDDADCRGDHKCCTNGCTFVCTPPMDEQIFPATQPEAARILPGVNVTEGRVGEPAELPCSAIGWPRPTVTWWRDATMLPLSSRRYEQMPDYALLIRSVVYEDRGDYSCHAHNGIGSGSTYRVTLIIDFQGSLDREDDIRESEPFNPDDSVPLSVSASLVTTDPVADSPLQVDCSVEAPTPGSAVSWRHDDVIIEGDDRRRILSNHTLYVTKAEVADSGEYRCSVEHAGSEASSSVTVYIRAKPTDSSCVDNPQFANCEIIVNARYCNNKYYGKFCCASCLRAGQFKSWPQE